MEGREEIYSFISSFNSKSYAEVKLFFLSFFSSFFSPSFFGLGNQQPVCCEKQSWSAGVARCWREWLLNPVGLRAPSLFRHASPRQRGKGSAHSHTAFKVQQLLVSMLPPGGTQGRWLYYNNEFINTYFTNGIFHKQLSICALHVQKAHSCS